MKAKIRASAMSFPLILEPPREWWAQEYEREAACIRASLGPVLEALHHIGSTAVPGIYAKPVIDMLAEVRDLEDLDGCEGAMAGLGYEVMGEFGIPGRRYFRRSDARGFRTHHVHAFLAGSHGVARHLAFRDYLRAHADVAREYSELKRRLVTTCAGDMEAYMDGKDAFVRDIERKALEWRRAAHETS